MSAICGYVVLDKTMHNEKLKMAEESFLKSYKEYKIDRHEYKEMDGAFLYCGVQYFNKEAQGEILPIIDEKTGLYFTADCILDNRQEMMDLLGITDSTMPDGSIIFEAYKKYRNQIGDYIRGCFSFVVYDSIANEVFLFADHFVQRCLFYTVVDGVLFFSTLFFPLLSAVAATGVKNTLDEQWLMFAITVRGPAIVVDSTIDTAVKEVKKVDSGRYVKISTDMKPQYFSYYDPEKVIGVDKSITEEECKKQLYAIMNKCIAEYTRTDGEVGVTLSSGLDSGVVAGFAAPFLAKQGKTLYSYTSIPLKESTHISDAYHVDDETEGVMFHVKKHYNIKPTFFDCRGKNFLNQHERILHISELPCKSQQNAVWELEMSEIAAGDNVKVLLTGATGNCTISAGDFTVYFHDLIKKGRLLTAIRKLNSFCTYNRYSKKRYLKYYAEKVWGNIYVKSPFYHHDIYDDGLTNEKKGEKYNLSSRLRGVGYGFVSINSIKQFRKELFLRNCYSQSGEYETGDSLVFGVVQRDPTRNVELVNYLYKLKYSFFVNEKFERRLVRDFLGEVLPDEIRLDTRHRGRQSADNAFRIMQDWDDYYPKMLASIKSPLAQEYLDLNKVKKISENLSRDKLIERERDMRMMVDAYAFVEYIDFVNKYIKLQM